MGGAGGVLGPADLDDRRVRRDARRGVACTCSRVAFAGGRIYCKAGVGAHALWGPVLAPTSLAAAPRGALGFPTTRVQQRRRRRAVRRRSSTARSRAPPAGPARSADAAISSPPRPSARARCWCTRRRRRSRSRSWSAWSAVTVAGQVWSLFQAASASDGAVGQVREGDQQGVRAARSRPAPSAVTTSAGKAPSPSAR